MTSATDNLTTELLHQGLTERGIEWRSGLEGVTFVGDWCFLEHDGGKLAATCDPVLTHEQAIAAMLGRGTCEMEPTFNEPVEIDGYFQEWQCLECCEFTLVESIDYNEKPRFCPNCGKKVE